MKTGRYSLAQLLDSDHIDRIIIPEMQRDYVWSVKNVDGLLNSIMTKFEEKESLQLSISNNGETVDSASIEYLTKEYERLRFNTRIGFIYAYYDSSDSRVLYLIDGQQRITTLFLFLLAIYAKGGDEYCSEFRKKYFSNKAPRLDYRVRENAHTYLIDFIDFTLSNPTKDFASESGRIYSDYSLDPTIRSIQDNYSHMRERLNRFDGDIVELLDYVENFIEFNYFDTGLSAQGERLYLYMNSRGEGLSFQEDIRPIIIGRCKPGCKTDGGRKWECWQNFFWIHRAGSPNADNGFWGFLKLAVILHQSRFGIPRWEEYAAETDVKLKNVREVREAFVSEKYIDKQHEWVRRYIAETENLTIDWLEECFAAYNRLSKLYDDSCDATKYPYQVLRFTDWRSVESFSTIHYVSICGLLEILIRQPDISDENLYRFGMYLLNRSDDSNNSKVPDSATLRAIDLSKVLSDAHISDIRELGYQPELAKKIPNMDCSASLIWKHIHIPEWEKLFWELTSNKTLDEFLDGCHDLLVKLSSETDNYTVEGIHESNKLFIEKFFDRQIKDDKSLRVELLAYGDISIRAGNDTWNFGEQMSRWKFPVNKEWLLFFDYEESIKFFRKFLAGAPASPVGWRSAIAKGVDYTWSYRYLWNFEEGDILPNIILLKSSQAKENLARSLPAHLLAKAIDGWNWEGDHRYADIDFNVDNGVFEKADNGCGTFALDFIFNWDSKRPYWETILKKRGDKIFTNEEIEALSPLWSQKTDLTELHLKQTFFDTEGYNSSGSLKSIEDITKWLDEYKPALASVLWPLVQQDTPSE